MQSSTSNNGVAPCPFRSGGGGGAARRRICCPLFRRKHEGFIQVRLDFMFLCLSLHLWASSCGDIALEKGDFLRPMSASVSACVLPTMPTWEGTCIQRTAAPACSISLSSCSHRSTCPTGPREPYQSWRRHLLALPVAPMTTNFESEHINVRF